MCSFHSEFSSAPCDISLTCDWLLCRGFGITILNRKARYLLAMVHGVGG